LRLATIADLPHISAQAAKFHVSVGPEWPWDAEAFENIARNCISGGFAMVSDNGFFLGIAAPYPISPTWVQAHELFLWSEDGRGGQFVRAFRKWAIAQGANEILWSCRADNERVTRFFSKIAKPVGVSFSEVL